MNVPFPVPPESQVEASLSRQYLLIPLHTLPISEQAAPNYCVDRTMPAYLPGVKSLNLFSIVTPDSWPTPISSYAS